MNIGEYREIVVCFDMVGLVGYQASTTKSLYGAVWEFGMRYM